MTLIQQTDSSSTVAIVGAGSLTFWLCCLQVITREHRVRNGIADFEPNDFSRVGGVYYPCLAWGCALKTTLQHLATKLDHGIVAYGPRCNRAHSCRVVGLFQPGADNSEHIAVDLVYVGSPLSSKIFRTTYKGFICVAHTYQIWPSYANDCSGHRITLAFSDTFMNSCMVHIHIHIIYVNVR